MPIAGGSEEGDLIVAITGWARDDDRRARGAGGDRHLIRSVDAEELRPLDADA